MTSQISTPSRQRSPPGGTHEVHFEGILWKRRDVFKNRWRPRWFVLNEREATLTYYLLQNNSVAMSLAMEAEIADDSGDGVALEEPNQEERRLRTTSNGEVSAVSELSLGPQHVGAVLRTPQRLDTSNVVPRGTIYLPACQIEANPVLTRPRESLYCFTIIPPTPHAVSTNATGASGGGATSQVHLAARSEETRQSWITKLRHMAITSTSANINASIATPVNMRGGAGESETTPIGESDPFGMGQNLRTRLAYNASTISESSTDGPVNETRGLSGADQSPSPTRPPAIQSSFSVLSENINPFSDPLESSLGHDHPSPTSTTWRSQALVEDYFQYVPPDLKRHVQSTIDEYLPQLQAPLEEGWKALSTPDISAIPVLQNLTGSMRVMDNKITIVRTTAYFSKFSPMQVAPILIHHEHRAAYEPTCVASHRIREFNSHTYLDVYHYASFWPRTVACCLHWRCMQKVNSANEKDSAILIVGAGSKHSSEAWLNSEVRKTPALAKFQKNKEANLIVSMVLLEPAVGGGTKWSRIVALDPNVPSFASQMAQSFFVNPQLEQPKAISRLLMGLDLTPTTPEVLSDQTVAQVLKGHSSARSLDHINDDIQSANETRELESTEGAPSRFRTPPSIQSPPFLWQATCLLMPVLLYTIAKQSNDLFLALQLTYVPLTVFLLSTWWSIRLWVLAHYSTSLVEPSTSPNPIASITCKFAVQVKGSLRYITNQKEEQDLVAGFMASDDNCGSSVDSKAVNVSMVHIVALAAAKVWSKHLGRNPRKRKLSVPWLSISQFFWDFSNDVDVALVLPAATRFLCCVNRLSVQEIANQVKSMEENNLSSSIQPGQDHKSNSHCAVVLAPSPTGLAAVSSSECNSEWMATCSGSTEMVVFIGGLVVDKSKSNNKRKPAEPLLNLSVTIRSEDAVSVGSRVIPELQTLIQFPEMCDS